MEQRTYHGKIAPAEVAQALLSRFTAEDMYASVTGDGGRLVVNITAGGGQGGRTSLAVGISPVSNGVLVTVGDQSLLGVAADLLQTGLGALRNPLILIGEIDDVARNVERLNLPAQVWEAVDHYARSVGAGLMPELTSVVCPYCGVLSPVGAGQCDACGAPLGRYQPIACPRCGQLSPAGLNFCMRCGSPLGPNAAKESPAGTNGSRKPDRPPMVAKFGP